MSATIPPAVLYSVVIPTCHRNDLLEKCLARLTPGTQTLSPQLYEVIVTDDGVKDTAERMIKARYPWARWVAGPRRGPAANRNHGAQIARGTFLVFVDDDCLPVPNWLEAYATEVVPSVHVYEGKTTCVSGFKSPLEEAPLNLTGGCLWSSNLMIRKSVFDELGGFDEMFRHAANEDADLRERIKQAGYDFPFVEAAVVDHPARRMPWGRRTAERWESCVLLWYKSGNRQSARKRFLFNIAKLRLRHVLKSSIGWDSLLAIVGMSVELWCVAWKLRTWDRYYRRVCGL